MCILFAFPSTPLHTVYTHLTTAAVVYVRRLFHSYPSTMKDNSHQHQALPLLSRDKRKIRQGRKSTSKSGSSLKKNVCFRFLVALISLQVFILFLVSLFLGNDLNRDTSRTRTLHLLYHYYEGHFMMKHHKPLNSSSSLLSAGTADLELASVPPGIVVDDDDAALKSGATAKDTDDDLHELEDHLANQTEEKLNRVDQELQASLESQDNDNLSSSKARSGLLLEDNTTNCIDNYFTRQIEKQEQIQQRREEGKAPFPFLIVGGSDGSGTRAFVTALGKLGIPMLVDDKGTMDVHGRQLFNKEGWPPLVQLVLNHTHSANYQVEDLPKDVRTTIMEELTKFKEAMVKRGEKHDRRNQERRNKKHIQVNHYDNSHHLRPVSAYHPLASRALLEQEDSFEDIENAAFPQLDNKPDNAVVDSKHRSTMIQYGWKAPVSMLLLPFLREVFGPIKFLHVVRDGRDIALSSNQSPVKKFYSAFYGKESLGEGLSSDATIDTNNTELMSVLAMQLWNDWNLQVLEYEKAHANDADFDYLVMHTEDLLNPETKFQSLQQLAHFIGSPNSLTEMCCQSQQAVVDMGESQSAIGGDGHGKRPKRHHAYDSWYGALGEIYEKEEHEKEVADFQTMLQGMNKKDPARTHNLRHHGVMGGDPVLGNMQDSDAEDDLEAEHIDTERFDKEQGRHKNWHHDHMDAASIMDAARKKHSDYMQQRADRFKGLQKRVADQQQRLFQHKNVHETKHRQHKPTSSNGEAGLHGKDGDTKDFAHQKRANHQARKEHHDYDNMSVDHHRQDKETKDFLMNHDHEARLEAMHGLHHGQESHSMEREPNAAESNGSLRRRLMSAFHKFGYRPKKMKTSTVKAPEGGLSPPSGEQKHRQFKPKRNEGEKVFQEQTPSSQQQAPQSTNTGGGWSMASISEALGFSSPYSKHSLIALPTGDATPNDWSKAVTDDNGDDDTQSGYDRALRDKFQHMPLLPIHSNRPPPHRTAGNDLGLANGGYFDHYVAPGKETKNSTAQVHSRYGKWVAYLADKPDLSRQLHDLGKESLEAFGYEPSTTKFMDTSGTSSSFHCDSTVVCPKKGTSPTLVRH